MNRHISDAIGVVAQGAALLVVGIGKSPRLDRAASPGCTRAMRSAVALLVAALSAVQACAAEDEWTSGDKRAHFLGGLVVGGIVLRAHRRARARAC